MRSKLHKLFARAPYRHLIAPTVCFMVVGATVILVGVGTGAKAWSEAAVSSDASGKTNATSRAVASARAKLAKVAAEASKVLSDPISSASDINATSKALAIAKAELEKVLAEESAGKTGLAKILTEANALSNTVSGIPGIAAEAKSGASTASKRWAGPAGTSRPTGATNEIGGTLGRDIGKFEAGEAKVQAEVGAVTQVVQSGENVASQMEADVSSVESGWKSMGKMPKADRKAPNAWSKSSVLPGSSMQSTSNNNIFSVGKDGLSLFDHGKALIKYVSSRTYFRVGGGWPSYDEVSVQGDKVDPQKNRFWIVGIGFRFFNPQENYKDFRNSDGSSAFNGPNPFRFELTRQRSGVDIRALASAANLRLVAKAQTSMANVYYDILYEHLQNPEKMRVTPYVSGAVGYTKFSKGQTIAGGMNQPSTNPNTTSVACSVGAGLIFTLNKRISFDAGYKHLHVGTLITPSTAVSSGFKTGINAHQFMGSVLFLF